MNSVVSSEDASSMPRSRTAEVRRKRRLLSSPRPVYRAIRTPLTDITMEEYCIPLGKSITKTRRWPIRHHRPLAARKSDCRADFAVRRACRRGLPGAMAIASRRRRPSGAPDLQPERRQPLYSWKRLISTGLRSKVSMTLQYGKRGTHENQPAARLGRASGGMG